MIQKISSTSRVTESDAVSFRMNGAYTALGLATDPHLQNMFTELSGLSASLTSAINRSKAESELAEYDEKRDEQVRALSYLILGFLHHPDANIKSAAQKVENVFDKYGVAITGESYATESSLVSSLLEDLSDETVQEAINSLSGCAQVIEALQAAESAFETARITYETKKAAESTSLNASAFKSQVLGLINQKIVVYLRAMEVVDEATFGTFARTIAQIIADNNEVVKKRRKKEVEEEIET